MHCVQLQRLQQTHTQGTARHDCNDRQDYTLGNHGSCCSWRPAQSKAGDVSSSCLRALLAGRRLRGPKTDHCCLLQYTRFEELTGGSSTGEWGESSGGHQPTHPQKRHISPRAGAALWLSRPYKDQEQSQAPTARLNACCLLLEE